MVFNSWYPVLTYKKVPISERCFIVEREAVQMAVMAQNAPVAPVFARSFWRFLFIIRIRLDLYKHLKINISEKSFTQRFDAAMTTFSIDKIKYTVWGQTVWVIY